MNAWTARPILLMLVATAACSEPPAPPQSQTTSVAAPAAKQPPKSEAVARADALLEDLRRREAAQAKFNRENPVPAANRIPASSPASPLTPSTVTASVASATPAPAAPRVSETPAATDPARDPAWWKQQLQSLQQTLDAALVQLAEAERLNFKNGYNDSQAEYKKRAAAVTNARLAIDRLHDDARRARVPPGWLR